MRKILVIGSSGAGKSTIARELGERLGIPVHHLDEHLWADGCRLVEPHEEHDRVAHLFEQPCWILDGNYTASLEHRLRLADTVVWVDYPRELCLYRALKRLVAHYGRNRPDMGGGCREELNLGFLKWIWLYPHRERPILRKMMINHGRHTRIVRLRFPHQAEKFLASASRGAEPAFKPSRFSWI
jgi:adenylate kinase family enzyme